MGFELTRQHVPVSVVRDGKQMGWHLISTFAKVELHCGWSVNRVPFVRIHSDTEQSGVGLEGRGSLILLAKSQIGSINKQIN